MNGQDTVLNCLFARLGAFSADLEMIEEYLEPGNYDVLLSGHKHAHRRAEFDELHADY